ncbi:MAG: ribonuclease HI [Bacteroidetes bacterium]|nr:ribonuclease HI [Bacteroidota bacterium]
MIDERVINIYTDGSSRSTPRRGGVGIRYIYVNESGAEISTDLNLPGYPNATSQEMELQACVLALNHLDDYPDLARFTKVVIYSDSKYVVDNFHNALFRWSKNGWTRKEGAPVLNATIWKELLKAIRKCRRRVEFTKVKGHSTDPHNKAVDKLAKISSSIPFNQALSPTIVRRKMSDRKTKIGSVLAIGQRITIRIVQSQYLREQKLYRYRYEVMSKSSPFYKNVDFAVTEHILREAHTYSVRINSEQANPRIVKVFRETIPNAVNKAKRNDNKTA